MPENKFVSAVLAKLPYSYNIIDKITQLNPKYEYFDKVAPRRDERLIQQSVLYQQPGLNTLDMSSIEQGAAQIFQNMRYHEFMYASLDTNKIRRIQDYRQMAGNAELSDAIDEICDEAIVKNEETQHIVNFTLRGEYEPDIKEELTSEWDKFSTIFDFENKGWEYFRQFLIEGELFFENVISKNRPDFGIIGLMSIPSELINPVYDNIQNGIIRGFLLRKPVLDPKNRVDKEQITFLDANQVTYVQSGIWNSDKSIRLPYIENSRRAYKQLTLLEDSIIIYRLVRAPEKLVFKVDVGNMSPPKVDAYMKRLMQQYWTRKSFDKSAGGRGITNIYDPQSILDSFWFPKRAGTDGSDVTQLAGGANLGQLDDLMYFIKKLYKTLKVPIGRLDPTNNFSDGTEITREELRFAKFVMRIQKQFAIGIKESFITHLKLNKMWKNYELRESDIFVEFNTPTHFAIMREQQVFELKYNNFNNMSQNENISNSFSQRYYLGWSDKQMAENREWLRKDAELQWELDQIRSLGPNFREQQAAIENAAAGIEGGGGGGGGGFTPELPPDFGPGPAPAEGGAEGVPPAEGGTPAGGGAGGEAGGTLTPAPGATVAPA